MGKITEEELKKVTELREELNKVVYSLGDLAFQKANIELAEVQVKDKMKEVRTKEVQVLSELKEKYGNVSINIETGEF